MSMTHEGVHPLVDESEWAQQRKHEKEAVSRGCEGGIWAPSACKLRAGCLVQSNAVHWEPPTRRGVG